MAREGEVHHTTRLDMGRAFGALVPRQIVSVLVGVAVSRSCPTRGKEVDIPARTAAPRSFVGADMDAGRYRAR